MREFGAFVLSIFAAILIVSCDKNSVQLVSQEATAALEKNWQSQVLPIRNIKGVDIYYDATPSMGGFVHDARYKKLVSQDVENAKPADVSATFYKATTDVPHIIQEIKSPVEAGKAGFYQKGNTRLDAIIDTADVGGRHFPLHLPQFGGLRVSCRGAGLSGVSRAFISGGVG